MCADFLPNGPVTWNLGNGAGHSVKQVIASVERVSGLKVPYQIVGRRAGDAAVGRLVGTRATAGMAPRTW